MARKTLISLDYPSDEKLQTAINTANSPTDFFKSYRIIGIRDKTPVDVRIKWLSDNRNVDVTPLKKTRSYRSEAQTGNWQDKSEEELRQILEAAACIGDAIEALGFTRSNAVGRRLVQRLSQEYDIQIPSYARQGVTKTKCMEAIKNLLAKELPSNHEPDEESQYLQSIINECQMKKDALHRLWPESVGQEAAYYKHLKRVAKEYNLDLSQLLAPNAKGQHDLSLFVAGRKMPATALRTLIDLRGEKCERCGLTEWYGRPAGQFLQVHHIDGDRSNNVMDNLKLLCATCHAMTDNFAAKNIGSASRSVTDEVLTDLIQEGLDIYAVLNKTGLRKTRRNYRRVTALYESLGRPISGTPKESPVSSSKTPRKTKQTKSVRPAYDKEFPEVAILVYNHTFDEVGQEFHHSGPWVMNVLRRGGLPNRRKEIRQYSQNEWKQLVDEACHRLGIE